MNDKRKTTIHTLIADALVDLDDYIKELAEEDEDWHTYSADGDRVYEIADGAVPIYNSVLLEVAIHDQSLTVIRSEFGSREANPTVVDVLKIVIYERILDALWNRYHEHEQAAYANAQDVDDSADAAV